MADRPSGVVPHLVVGGGKEAIAFYTKAFGAEVECEVPADDGKRLMHASIRIGGAHVFLCDDFPEYCHGKSSTPLSLGGTPVTLHQAVADVDAAVAKAAAAGGEIVMPAADMFWGERYGQIKDPFGHLWSFGGPLKGDQPAKEAC
jgi:PhnB protein